VNQQLLIENTFLKDEMSKSKTSILTLIEENSRLHTELKNATVTDILAEFNQDNDFNNQIENNISVNPNSQNTATQVQSSQLKNKK
jgi:hypothetical protein